VKALKLARALGTRDDDLDERIEMVEGRLAALGLLEVEPPAVRPSAPAATPASTPVDARPPSAALPVVSLSDDDPFSMSTGDDTGVWTSPEDPFADDVPAPPAPEPDDHQATMPIPRSEIAAAVEQRAAEAPVVEPRDVGAPLDGEPAQAPDDDRPELAEMPDIEAVAATAETITLPPRPASAPDPTGIVEEFDAEDEDDATADEVPVPTLTLARLAVSQGDLELAERTLDGLLERVPDSAEATELLEEVRRRRAGELPSAPSIQAAQKIAALQRWLEAIRLAAERRTL
jgi:hypothetical protein